MPLKALIRNQPERAIALVSKSHVLTFHHDSQDSSKCHVDLVKVSSFDSREFFPLGSGVVHGTLGLINVDRDIFLCLATAVTERAEVKSGEIIKQILDVEFYGLKKGDYDYTSYHDPYIEDHDGQANSRHEASLAHDRRESMLHPCQALKKLLGDGSFYYSLTFDLTCSLQRRAANESKFDIDSLDRAYLWNSYMIDPLIDFRSRLAASERKALDDSGIITTVIRGYVEAYHVPPSRSPLAELPAAKPSRLLLISRLSCRRAGTRFNARGIDDNGNVANFVETETLFWHPSGLCFSYTQVRGSVPIFWEQTAGLVPQQQKIQITRSKEATQLAFDKHMDELEYKYGSLQVLNLLAERKPGEDMLSQLYHEHVRIRRAERKDDLLMATHYDFHSETSGAEGYMAANAIRQGLNDRAESMAYFLADIVQDYQTAVVLQQQGIFRTNCLDCLDRTNLVQTILSEMALNMFLDHRGEGSGADLATIHGTLWANNGDALSKIYAGTGALKSSFTRHGKMSLAGAIADARKSVKRLYVNNFQDGARQLAIDTLLGRLVSQSPVYLYDPVSEHIRTVLETRQSEFTKSSHISIWAGTFNLNGKSPSDRTELSQWLRPAANNAEPDPDVFVIAFQEIVQLSPQQIMSTDPAYLREWEQSISDELNSRSSPGTHEYIQLRSGQLVGAALIIYVRSQLLPTIKNVEGTNKKTGMSGIAGNKGAVAIRMDISDTRFCFVTSHLAAGHSNVDDRNRDFHTIANGLRFPRDRSIDDHDVVVWLGDFNYRINGENERVRQLIKDGDLDTLYRFDQLNQAMEEATAFPYYSEGTITFRPTYKYDNGTDEYDTSEKQRIPAWCDRILFKGKGVRQTSYNTVPLFFSDHRPVYSHFICAVAMIDEAGKARLVDQLQQNYRKPAVQASDQAKNSLNHGEAAPEPVGSTFEPTSDRKWWLRDGLAARSDIDRRYSGMTSNPLRPANPFLLSEEPDWERNIGRFSNKPGSHRHFANDQTTNLAISVLPDRKPAPAIPRKPDTLAMRGHGTNAPSGNTETESQLLGELGDLAPDLPPRPTVVKESKPKSESADNVDLLMLNEPEELSRIPSLIPSRR